MLTLLAIIIMVVKSFMPTKVLAKFTLILVFIILFLDRQFNHFLFLINFFVRFRLLLAIMIFYSRLFTIMVF